MGLSLWDVFANVCCYCHATYVKVPGLPDLGYSMYHECV